MPPSTRTTANEVIRDLGDIDFLAIAAVIVVAFVLVGAIRILLPRLGRLLPSRHRHLLLPVIPVARLLIGLAAVLIIVPLVIEPSVSNVIALLGAAGIAVGFAFKDYASSLIAGIVALYERPYRPGDWVRVAGVYGEVSEIGMRSLTIRTPDDDTVAVPHLELWTEAVYNANDAGRTLMVVTEFHLAPDHDAAAVRSRLEEVGLTSCYLDLDRPLLVVLSEEPWGTRYRLKAYPQLARQQFLFRSDLTVRGKAALTAMGCSFASVPPLAGALPASGSAAQE